MDIVNLALRLTFVDLLLRPIGNWAIRPFILGLAPTTDADGFVVVPQNSEGLAAGETAEIWLYE